jgi:hypothetical protein
LPYEKSAKAAGIRGNRGGATVCGIGFCPETKLSGVSHDADKDLSLSFKRVS